MRASSLILASLGFIHDLRNGVLPPDDFRGSALDMSQYLKLFGTSRIPTKTGCRLQVDPDASHIVVMRRGQFYWFDVLDAHHRPCLTERALLSNLTAIIADADRTPPNQVAPAALGVLSTERRATWAAHRTSLMKETANSQCLDVLDKALFVVCLDDTSPQTASEMCANMLCGTYRLERGVQVGTCTNRFYDKLQIIVAQNGAAGVNFEHSGVDGHTVLRFVADVYTELILRFAKSINSHSATLFKAKLSPWATGAGARKPSNGRSDGKEEDDDEEREEIDTAPKKLEWVLSPELKLAVRFAETRLSDLICQNEVLALEFDGFGKNTMTQYGFSPDAFVQMGYQAAYFSLYGRTESTYEPAMTKAFLHGRTEAIRTVTPQSVEFVRTFSSETATPRQKMDALRKACKVHTDLTRQCMKGLGQDRILYAMMCLAQRGDRPSSTSSDSSDESSASDSEGSAAEKKSPVPALFADPGWAELGHSVLSTSNCGNPSLRLFGFGAVVPDGYGIGYIIKDDSIAFCASSRFRQTQRFLDTLQAYFAETHRMLRQLHREANRKPNETFVDHHVGEVDARTGKPLRSHVRQNGSVDETKTVDDEESGYTFFGDLDDGVKKLLDGQRVPKGERKRGVPTGTRIQTVELS